MVLIRSASIVEYFFPRTIGFSRENTPRVVPSLVVAADAGISTEGEIVTPLELSERRFKGFEWVSDHLYGDFAIPVSKIRLFAAYLPVFTRPNCNADPNTHVVLERGYVVIRTEDCLSTKQVKALVKLDNYIRAIAFESSAIQSCPYTRIRYCCTLTLTIESLRRFGPNPKLL